MKADTKYSGKTE